MSSPKVVFVARFEVPTESTLFRRPEHEIQHRLSRDGICGHAAPPHMDPLWADARHEFHFLRERPGLLEQKIDIPFCGVTAKNRRYARLKFKPLLDGRYLNSCRGRDIRSARRNIPTGRYPDFNDG
jgi:hypothetical protein